MAKEPLYPLKRAIQGLGQFLLYSKLYKRFVDQSGRIFTYEKTMYVPLIYKKIRRSIPYKSGTMILFEDIHCPIWFYRPTAPEEEYGALLVVNRGYILLGLTRNQSSKRKRFKI